MRAYSMPAHMFRALLLRHRLLQHESIVIEIVAPLTDVGFELLFGILVRSSSRRISLGVMLPS